LLIDSIAEQTAIATNHSCETLAIASITKTRRQTNALNLLAIPIVNPRVSRVMKHRRRLYASEGSGTMFPEITVTFETAS